MSDAAISKHLHAVRDIARVLDDLVIVPGTRLRVGLDPLIGLLPFVGDVVGATFSGYCILIALWAGAPLPVILRMMLNVSIDLFLGFIPVIGDMFDIAFASNRRNLTLLESYLASQQQTRASSLLVVGVVLVLCCALVLAMLMGLFVVLQIVARSLAIPLV
jgi:hypothetical protein